MPVMDTHQFAALIAAIVPRLPRNLDPALVQRWIDAPAGLEAALAQALGVFPEEAPSAEPAPKPPLVGRVVKTIIIPAYEATDFADAVRLGNFNNANALGDTIRQFGKEQVGLDKPVKIDLVEFDRDWWNDEAIAWGVANGNRKPMRTAHIMGIAIKLPDEQRKRPIAELGSVQHGHVLYLYGSSGWRNLYRDAVESYWNRRYLVGFLSE